MKNLISIILLQFVLVGGVMSQVSIPDSCTQIINSNAPDTSKIKAWYKIGSVSVGINKSDGFHSGLAIAKRIADYRLIATGYYFLESHFEQLGQKDSAYYYILKQIAIGKKINDYRIIGHGYSSLFFILTVYYNKNEVAYLDTAILALRKTNNKGALVNALLRKMEYLRDYKPEMSLQDLMDEIDRVEKNKKENLDYLASKVIYYQSKHQIDSAIYETILLNDQYLAKKEYRFVSYNYSVLARLYSEIKDFENAEKYSQLGIQTAVDHQLKKEMVDNLQALFSIYLEKKDYKNALSVNQRLFAFKDSVNTSDFDKAKAAYNLQLKGDLLLKDNELNESKVGQQRIIIVFAVCVMVLILIFFMYVIKKWRETRSKNEIISSQKILVEQKNQEITESIQYALRIQKAILPPKKLVKQYLEDSFILYKPKDIVAGDFYWIYTFEDCVLFAACDCTGHGVPGAMVSVVCHNALERVVKEFRITDPGLILAKTTELVIENFSRSEETVRDGMDISLCLLNTQTRELKWAGANNPLWLVSNGELTETKANKQPIGVSDLVAPYTTHTFQLNKNDTIYIFSDGYADQFGGEVGQKKLTKKRFKDLVLSLQSYDMQVQGLALNNFIVEYQKDLEQIDDILVIGVKA